MDGAHIVLWSKGPSANGRPFALVRRPSRASADAVERPGPQQRETTDSLNSAAITSVRRCREIEEVRMVKLLASCRRRASRIREDRECARAQSRDAAMVTAAKTHSPEV